MRSALPAPTWVEKAKKIISRIFSFTKGVVIVLFDFLDNGHKLTFEAFNAVMKKAFDPLFIAQFFTAIAMAVLVWAIVQWWFIGLWLCAGFGIKGYAAGVIGLVIGIALNYVEIVPELWQIYEQYAVVYAKHGSGKKFQDAPPTVEDAAKNFSSFASHKMTFARAVALLIESTINIVYAYSTKGGFTFPAIIYAAALLRLPEFTLKMCSHAVSMMVDAHESGKFNQPNQWQ